MIKKGTFVKFVGSDKLKSVNTYVYGVKGNVVLIEHPQGLLATDPEVKQHMIDNYGFSVNKAQRFVEVKSTELIGLNKDGSVNTQIQPQKQHEIVVMDDNYIDEIIEVKIPKSFLYNIHNYFVNQQMAFDAPMDLPLFLKPMEGALKKMMHANKDEIMQHSEYMISSVDEILKATTEAQIIVDQQVVVEQSEQPKLIDQSEEKIEQSPQENPTENV